MQNYYRRLCEGVFHNYVSTGTAHAKTHQQPGRNARTCFAVSRFAGGKYPGVALLVKM